MSRRLIVPLLALLCLLSGCSAWRNDDYLSLSPHCSATTQTASPDAVTVENYLGLKNAILGFIREGQANGTIRVTNYDGDVEVGSQRGGLRGLQARSPGRLRRGLYDPRLGAHRLVL